MEDSPFYRLSDCILIKLLSFLDATSLYNLSSTCKVFNEIVKDKELWRYIDARDDPNHNEKVYFVVDRIHQKSRTLLMRAQSYTVGLVPSNFFKIVSPLDNIKILALENQYFNGELITIKNFPRNLEELSLRRSYISKCRDFFRLSKEHVLDLRVLILDDCQWVDCGCLMSISKYQNLEIISLIKCRQLDNDAIAYFGLARLGYKKLRIFDSRFTVLGSPVLSSFFTHETLLAYYFQHERSYAADYGVVKDGAALKSVYHCFTDMTDRALLQFLTIIGKGVVEELPKSQLYVDPYGECTCSYKDGAVEEEEQPLKEDEVCKCCGNTLLLVQEPARLDDEQTMSKTCSTLIANQPLFMSCFRRVISNDRARNNEAPPPAAPNQPDPSASPPQKRRRLNPAANGDNQAAGPSREDPTRHIRVSITQNGARIEEMEGQPIEDFARIRVPGPSRPHLEQVPDEQVRARVLINVHIQRDGPEEQEPQAAAAQQEQQPGEQPQEQQDPPREARPGRVQRGCCIRLRRRPPEEMPFLDRVIDFINIGPDGNNRYFNGNVEIVPANQVPLRQIPLRRLSLRGFRRITNVSLTYLKDLQLDLLDLTYTACTKDGIREYLSYNPNCRVIHKDFCRCVPRMPF